MISIFLSWFTASFKVAGISAASASGSGTTAHGYLYVVFFVSLVVVAYLVVRAGWPQLPFKLPVSEGSCYWCSPD